jgi:hypothetical protein
MIKVLAVAVCQVVWGEGYLQQPPWTYWEIKNVTEAALCHEWTERGIIVDCEPCDQAPAKGTQWRKF